MRKYPYKFIEKHTIIFIGLTLLLLPLSVVAADLDELNKPYQEVLKSFVQNGLVDYGSLKDKDAIERFLEEGSKITQNEFGQWTEEAKLAYLINLYNAYTLKLIKDHYPIKSIKDINLKGAGPWDIPIVKYLGKDITLNQLEYDIILKEYDEPRVHFALVCAALGCPVLLNKPYTGEMLDTQLEEQTKLFLGDKTKNYYEQGKNTLHLSPIFKWFGPQFDTKYGSVLEFVTPHIPGLEDARGAGQAVSIEYTDYDWSLNDITK